MRLLVGYEDPAGSGAHDVNARVGHGMAHAVPEGSTTSLCGALHLRFDTGTLEWPPRSFAVPHCPVCRQKATSLRAVDET